MTGTRCWGDGDPLFERYHDEEWGFPVLDGRGLFEKLSLEAFQSGLSWRTILTKREAFRAASRSFSRGRGGVAARRPTAGGRSLIRGYQPRTGGNAG